MAVTNEKAAQLADGYRGKTYDDEKVRFAHFEFTQGAAAGDAGSTADLVKLPAGNVRLLPGMSKVYHSALGASRTLDIGHPAYTGADGVAVAADDDAFTAAGALDVSSAGTNVAFDAAVRKFDMFSRGGITVQGIVQGGTIPAGATIFGYVAYQHF